MADSTDVAISRREDVKRRAEFESVEPRHGSRRRAARPARFADVGNEFGERDELTMRQGRGLDVMCVLLIGDSGEDRNEQSVSVLTEICWPVAAMASALRAGRGEGEGHGVGEESGGQRWRGGSGDRDHQVRVAAVDHDAGGDELVARVHDARGRRWRSAAGDGTANATHPSGTRPAGPAAETSSLVTISPGPIRCRATVPPGSASTRRRHDGARDSATVSGDRLARLDRRRRDPHRRLLAPRPARRVDTGQRAAEPTATTPATTAITNQ